MRYSLFAFRLKHILNVGLSYSHRLGKRTLLSQAYQCEEAWNKRLESPLLKNIEMDKYFVTTDKKFNTKNLASGVDIDLFANVIQDSSQLDELEHLLYRFRRTKRACEMMDSTIYAVVKIFLKQQDYESLFRILQNQESYGIFPDLFSYNILMDTFIEQKMFKEAAQIAVLMMLQEDFSNDIGSFLAVYSCHLFLKNNELASLYPKPEVEQKEGEEEEEEELVRVPFFRNPWFDDHFDLTEPRHLVGKTFFLAGRQMKDKLLGNTFQLIGLTMYEKWDNALELLNLLTKSETPGLLSEGVEEWKKYMDTVPSEELKEKFEGLLNKMQESGQIKSGNFEEYFTLNISKLPALEKQDIEKQKELFEVWEQERQIALKKQNIELEKERRLEEITKKKEYLYWKEKMLFFFENEDRILEEFKKAEDIKAEILSQKTEDETYVPPEVTKLAQPKLTIYQKLAKVKTM